MRTPQWSPVMKTGNTSGSASAESLRNEKPQWSPVMKTGNTTTTAMPVTSTTCLNGARS